VAHSSGVCKEKKKRMDVVTMVLIQTKTRIPLDVVVFINNFLYEKLTDHNFEEAITLWFRNEMNCRRRFGPISDWNTSRVTNMRAAFHRRDKFNENLSHWNVRNVTDMSFMFCLASQFNGDLSQWNVSQVTIMLCMFYEATQFNGDLSRWDVSRVTDLSYMFSEATRFNGDISCWNVISVEYLVGCSIVQPNSTET
jgi:surface protein